MINCGRVFVQLKQEGKEFNWLVGALPASTDYVRFHGIWQDAVTGWNEGWTEEDRQRVWESGPVIGNSVQFLEALKRKGLKWERHHV
jgi:hypothetical protein